MFTLKLLCILLIINSISSLEIDENNSNDTKPLVNLTKSVTAESAINATLMDAENEIIEDLNDLQANASVNSRTGRLMQLLRTPNFIWRQRMPMTIRARADRGSLSFPALTSINGQQNKNTFRRTQNGGGSGGGSGGSDSKLHLLHYENDPLKVAAGKKFVAKSVYFRPNHNMHLMSVPHPNSLGTASKTPTAHNHAGHSQYHHLQKQRHRNYQRPAYAGQAGKSEQHQHQQHHQHPHQQTNFVKHFKPSPYFNGNVLYQSIVPEPQKAALVQAQQSRYPSPITGQDSDVKQYALPDQDLLNKSNKKRENYRYQFLKQQQQQQQQQQLQQQLQLQQQQQLHQQLQQQHQQNLVAQGFTPSQTNSKEKQQLKLYLPIPIHGKSLVSSKKSPNTLAVSMMAHPNTIEEATNVYQQHQSHTYAVYEEDLSSDAATDQPSLLAAKDHLHANLEREAENYLRFMNTNEYFLPKYEPNYRILDEQVDKGRLYLSDNVWSKESSINGNNQLQQYNNYRPDLFSNGTAILSTSLHRPIQVSKIFHQNFEATKSSSSIETKALNSDKESNSAKQSNQIRQSLDNTMASSNGHHNRHHGPHLNQHQHYPKDKKTHANSQLIDDLTTSSQPVHLEFTEHDAVIQQNRSALPDCLHCNKVATAFQPSLTPSLSPTLSSARLPPTSGFASSSASSYKYKQLLLNSKNNILKQNRTGSGNTYGNNFHRHSLKPEADQLDPLRSAEETITQTEAEAEAEAEEDDEEEVEISSLAEKDNNNFYGRQPITVKGEFLSSVRDSVSQSGAYPTNTPTTPVEQTDTEEYCEGICATVEDEQEEILCGSDGYMYTSEAQLECYASCLHIDITIQSKGSCATT